jgi:hypothetical protein
MKHILSLGAGVQSSTLALMAARGEVAGYPRLDAAIFADTQDEPASVYKWLDWLEAEIARSPHPFPVHRVTAGRLSERVLTTKTSQDGRCVGLGNIPMFTKSDDGTTGQMPSRACTYDFKIKPILRLARKLGGIKRGQKTPGVTQWIGISLDEVHRMKPSRDAWAACVWPLVDMRMRRHDCLLWMERNGYPKPPRSSCVFCPYHSNAEWRRLKDEEPEAFATAVQFERDLQRTKGSTDNMHAVPFLHRSCVPLDQVDLRTLEDHGQTTLDLWGEECTGMCGV